MFRPKTEYSFFELPRFVYWLVIRQWANELTDSVLTFPAHFATPPAFLLRLPFFQPLLPIQTFLLLSSPLSHPLSLQCFSTAGGWLARGQTDYPIRRCFSLFLPAFSESNKSNTLQIVILSYVNTLMKLIQTFCVVLNLRNFGSAHPLRVYLLPRFL